MARRRIGQQREMRGAGDARQQVHLQPGRQRAGQPGIEEIHAAPALHDPAHQARRHRVHAQRLVGDAVGAETRAPLDDVAVHLVRLGHGQTQAGIGEHQPRAGQARAPALVPLHRVAGRQAGIERGLFAGAQAARAEPAPLHAALRQKGRQRVGQQAGAVDQVGVEGGQGVGHGHAPARFHAQAVAAGRQRQAFEQGAQRQLAGMAVEVVHAVAARIEAMHDDVARLDDLKAPRLRVVAAGRPARLVEDVFQYGIELRCLRHLRPLRRTPARDDGHCQPLQRVAVAARTPGMHELVAVGIEMHAMGRGQYLAAFQ